MERRRITPRAGADLEVEALGLTWHTTDGKPYWDESAYYLLTEAEVDELEAATNELHARCLDAVDFVVRNNRFADLAIPSEAIPLIRRSWEQREASLYGRFDLAYDGVNPPRLLEYNADTPTALLEAAVIQWYWLEAVKPIPDADQFNSLWEALVARWKEIQSSERLPGPLVHFGYAAGSDEDYGTVVYVLQETAKQAGLQTDALPIKEIGWDYDHRRFVGHGSTPLGTVFKLYPWEWLLRDQFAGNLIATYGETRWIEPIWKMVLSNKGILAILWELFPNHPNLLPAYFEGPGGMTEYVRKPLLSREGANIYAVTSAGIQETAGLYGGKVVYQAYAPPPSFDGNYPVIGSWVIGNEAHGIGIRESDHVITDNLSRFVPHCF